MLDPRGPLRAIEQNTGTLLLAAARGLIVDCSGAELAVTVSAPSVYATRAAIAEGEETARAIADALDSDTATVRRRLESNSPFIYVKRWIRREQAEAIRALGLPGVGIILEPRRAYPLGELAGQVLGFANIDGEGKRGIEQSEDSWLRGEAQVITVEREGHGQLLVSSGLDPRSAVGGDVALTLDATLQAEIDASLQEVIEATGALRGTVVSMDPRTGDILALSELPSFDPNNFRTTPYAATRSRAFLDAVEPGSVLKPFVVAAALQHGAVSKDDEIDCGEGLPDRGKTLRDRKPFGVVDTGGCSASPATSGPQRSVSPWDPRRTSIPCAASDSVRRQRAASPRNRPACCGAGESGERSTTQPSPTARESESRPSRSPRRRQRSPTVVSGCSRGWWPHDARLVDPGKRRSRLRGGGQSEPRWPMRCCE